MVSSLAVSYISIEPLILYPWFSILAVFFCCDNVVSRSEFADQLRRRNFGRDKSVAKTMIHLAEIETGLTKFCELIGGYIYLANQV
jgi:hypothetical protein